MKKLAETYTKNQTAAIAIEFGTALWGLTTMAATLLYMPPETFTGVGLFWVLMNIIGWILVLLMVMLVRLAFLAALILTFVYQIGHVSILAAGGMLGLGWWNFGIPWLHFTYLIAWAACWAAIYFNYKSYMELKK